MKNFKEKTPTLYLTAAWLLAALGLAVCLKTTWEYRIISGDLTQDYYAAKALLHGESIYGSAPHDLGRQDGRTEITGNFHPPLVALLAVPLTSVSYPTAYLIWNALSLMMLYLTIRVLCHEFSLPKSWVLPGSGISLLSYPAIAGFANGPRIGTTFIWGRLTTVITPCIH